MPSLLQPESGFASCPSACRRPYEALADVSTPDRRCRNGLDVRRDAAVAVDERGGETSRIYGVVSTACGRWRAIHQLRLGLAASTLHELPLQRRFPAAGRRRTSAH